MIRYMLWIIIFFYKYLFLHLKPRSTLRAGDRVGAAGSPFILLMYLSILSKNVINLTQKIRVQISQTHDLRSK